MIFSTTTNTIIIKSQTKETGGKGRGPLPCDLKSSSFSEIEKNLLLYIASTLLNLCYY